MAWPHTTASKHTTRPTSRTPKGGAASLPYTLPGVPYPLENRNWYLHCSQASHPRPPALVALTTAPRPIQGGTVLLWAASSPAGLGTTCSGPVPLPDQPWGTLAVGIPVQRGLLKAGSRAWIAAWGPMCVHEAWCGVDLR